MTDDRVARALDALEVDSEWPAHMLLDAIGEAIEALKSEPEPEPPREVPFWLPAAIYRTIADPYIKKTNHRNMLAEAFNDFPREVIDKIVDDLIAYGAVCETGETEKQYGDLSAVPYQEDTVLIEVSHNQVHLLLMALIDQETNGSMNYTGPMTYLKDHIQGLDDEGAEALLEARMEVRGRLEDLVG